MVDESSPPNYHKRFFSNPVVGVIGSIASVLGVTLAIYFYVTRQEYRDLRYFVNPARAAVIQAGKTSRLSITLDQKPISQDVSVVQVAFWNEGKKSIRSDNILRPLVIKTAPQFPILEAEIRKESREVVEVKLNRSRMEIGEIEIDWNILEHNDGAIIQLVYVGNPQVPITALATVEGQSKIKELQYGGKIKTPDEQYKQFRSEGKVNRIIAYVFASMGVLLVAYTLHLRRLVRNKDWIFADLLRKVVVTLIIMSLVIVVLAIIVILLRTGSPNPPFG